MNICPYCVVGRVVPTTDRSDWRKPNDDDPYETTIACPDCDGTGVVWRTPALNAGRGDRT